MLTLTIKKNTISLGEIKKLTRELDKTGASLFTETNLLLEVEDVLLDNDEQNVIASTTNSDITNKG